MHGRWRPNVPDLVGPRVIPGEPMNASAITLLEHPEPGARVMIEPSGDPPEAAALAPVLQAFSPMALHMHRGSGDVVGRPAELAAIGQEIASAGRAGWSV